MLCPRSVGGWEGPGSPLPRTDTTLSSTEPQPRADVLREDPRPPLLHGGAVGRGHAHLDGRHRHGGRGLHAVHELRVALRKAGRHRARRARPRAGFFVFCCCCFFFYVNFLKTIYWKRVRALRCGTGRHGAGEGRGPPAARGRSRTTDGPRLCSCGGAPALTRIVPSRTFPPTLPSPANSGAAPVMPASGFPRRGPMGARGPAGLGVWRPALPSAPMSSCRVRAGGCARRGAAGAAAGGRGVARRRSGPGAVVARRMARAPRWMLGWLLLACCVPHTGTRPGPPRCSRGDGRDVGGCRPSACRRASLGR